MCLYIGLVTVTRASLSADRGREVAVNGHSHRTFCRCLYLRPFLWSQRTAAQALHIALTVVYFKLSLNLKSRSGSDHEQR